MPRAPQTEYFTKHLFRTGVQCITKLYYKVQSFPQNQQSDPFIKHAVLNKKLLKSLAWSAYPTGKFIEGDSVSESKLGTAQQLQQKSVVLFDAVFEWREMVARLPIVAKDGNELTVYHIQSKAFDSQKHWLVDNQGRLYDKWRTYLLDFAYQLFILKQSFPNFNLKPILILPEKKALPAQIIYRFY